MDYFVVELKQKQKIGIPLDMVGEVIAVNCGEICPVPGVKSSLLGVINHRGKLLWLLDLTSLLGIIDQTQKKVTNLTILVTKFQEKQFGLVVTRLKEIINISEEEELNKLTDLEENKYIKAQSKFNEKEVLSLINIPSVYNYIHD